MGTGLCWEVTGLVVQRTGDPLTATLYFVYSGPITSEKEMGTSESSEKCPITLFIFFFDLNMMGFMNEVGVEQCFTHVGIVDNQEFIS